jgi:putative ABC transport system permease protein
LRADPAFAARYLRRSRLRVDSEEGPRYEIVGVVADAVYTTPRDGMLPTLYEPLAQRELRDWNSWRDAVLTIKTAPGQRALVERDVAAALTHADPTLVFTSGTFGQVVEATVTQERLIAMMSGFFGALALLLAGLGLYGIVAQAVTARRTEIGLRIALGAQPPGIARLVVRRVDVLILAGLALGLAGSLWAARFIAPLLFQVEARDPLTFAGTAAVLVAVGVDARTARSTARPGDRAATRIGRLAHTTSDRSRRPWTPDGR